jgi:hypothetical protein
VFAAGVWRLFSGRLSWKQMALYLVVPLACVLILCWQNAKAFNVRYVLVSLPAFLCVLALGLQAFRPPVKQLLTVLVFGTLLLSLGNYYFNDRYAREDVRGAARYIEKNAVSDECILVPTVIEVFDYYYDGESPIRNVWIPAGTPQERIDEQLDKVFATCSTVWYVAAREWDHDKSGYLRGALDSRCRVVETMGDLAGVSITKYERKNESP